MCEISTVIDDSHESVIYCQCGGYLESVSSQHCKVEPFDITQHEWSGDQVEGATVEDECLFIDDNDYDISTISIDRKDAIAIAKHFKLTAEDLK